MRPLVLIALAIAAVASCNEEARTEPENTSGYRHDLIRLTVSPARVELRCGERADIVLHVDRQAGDSGWVDGYIVLRHHRLPLGTSVEVEALEDFEEQTTGTIITRPSCDVGDFDLEFTANGSTDDHGAESTATIALSLRP